MAQPAIVRGRAFSASSRPEDAPRLQAASSNPSPFILHRRSHTGWETTPFASDTLARPKSSSNLLSTDSSFYAGDLHDTLLLGEAARSRRARDDIQALVDFLKNHPPPPDNFMSIPYGDYGEDERGRWAKIRRIGRRSKSMPREPQHIQLPDSAVSGVTIGGHRHIAISIPLEASPFGDAARSQYPVYPQQDLSMGTPSKEAIRTYTNEKGVVTVLRPVTEVSEPSSDTTSSSKPSHYPVQRSASHRVGGYLSPGRRLGADKPHDYIGVLPTQLDSPLLDDGSAPWNRAPSRGEPSETARGRQSCQSFQRSAYPARGSSMIASRTMQQPLSIDGLISQQERERSAKYGPREGNFLGSSTIVTNHKGAPEATARPPKHRPAPILTGGRTDAINGQDNKNHLTVISDSPIICRRDDSPPPTPGSTKSRKDVVRDRKRRDMEAVRSANQKKQGEEKETGGLPESRDGEVRKQASTKAKREPAHQLAISSVMVVLDVEPSPSFDEGRRSLPPNAATSSKDKRRISEGLAAASDDVNVLTPPVSTSSSPPQQHGAMDRTSLTRRREWKAIRDKERNARDAVLLARAKAKRLASASSFDESQASQTDKEIMRLYEAYREHRLRDMERRLRRLERNGDVWLRALVPVLDNMNRTMAAANEEPLDDGRDWASDDDAISALERIGRDAERYEMKRRASLSRGRLLEKLAHQKEDDDTWSDSVTRSDDMSGFGTIEPLMRELAGEARRRQRVARPLGITNEDAYHAI
ncbi:hypothetical protein PCL_12427 [Purpureocillium lilacinum]|uniref:Uncharacterized protein n=1 Tax=Purpureocillium lilacinum TaxID=33203 RepID=A0A179H9P6_PURLI|nr:hypothetical protein Purlil1_7289 [Purpureocillium lilacinum]OAQ86418.1 hypothetical protein VFPBJ_00458 [Purpureocillium lilacinum]PWI71059.1 hypothetical protein PCL_12427 [Purpureocillium lilacinum]GJN67339.1 hypothetical protein PLICBS_001363 [Purpureocillium lilacinum]